MSYLAEIRLGDFCSYKLWKVNKSGSRSKHQTLSPLDIGWSSSALGRIAESGQFPALSPKSARQGTSGNSFWRTFDHDRVAVTSRYPASLKEPNLVSFFIMPIFLLVRIMPTLLVEPSLAIVMSSRSPAFWRGSRISAPCQLWSAEGHPRLQSAWAF